MSLCTCCLPGPSSGSVTVGLLASQVRCYFLHHCLKLFFKCYGSQKKDYFIQFANLQLLIGHALKFKYPLYYTNTRKKDHSETQANITHFWKEFFSFWPKTLLPGCPSFCNVSSIFFLVENIIVQVSQLARATVVTSRLARRESKRGQSKALRRQVHYK